MDFDAITKSRIAQDSKEQHAALVKAVAANTQLLAQLLATTELLVAAVASLKKTSKKSGE
jgi:hypothetical protein